MTRILTIIALLFATINFINPANAQGLQNIVIFPISVSPEFEKHKDLLGGEIQKALSNSFNVFYGKKVEEALEAEDFNQTNCEPLLGKRELASTIQSAWNYKLSGQARRPNEQFAKFNVSKEELDTLMSDPKALALLVYLRLNMPPHEFAAPQINIAKKIGWAPMTVNRALKSLQEHGFIERVRKQKVSDQPLPAIIYRFL